MLCNYSFVGVKYENGEVIKVDYKNKVTKENKLENFLAGQNAEVKTIWIELKITANEL